jgi:hypothetical protein
LHTLQRWGEQRGSDALCGVPVRELNVDLVPVALCGLRSENRVPGRPVELDGIGKVVGMDAPASGDLEQWSADEDCEHAFLRDVRRNVNFHAAGHLNLT